MIRVLLPTDFSANAHNALHFASKLYVNKDVEFVFFHSCGSNYDEALKLMSNETIRAKEKYEINCIGIVEETSTNPVKVIVMGTKGSSGLKEVLFGSNTVKVVDSVDIPVWVIPKSSKFWKFEHTLFCADYEDLDYEKSLNYYKELILDKNALLKILHIKTGESNREEHKEHINETRDLRDYFLPEIEVQSRCVKASDVEKGINWYLKKHPEIDNITVVNHKRNFLANLFKSNRAHQLAFHSNFPLLVLQDFVSSL